MPTIKELTSLGRWCDLDANYLGIGSLWIGDFAPFIGLSRLFIQSFLWSTQNIENKVQHPSC